MAARTRLLAKGVAAGKAMASRAKEAKNRPTTRSAGTDPDSESEGEVILMKPAKPARRAKTMDQMFMAALQTLLANPPPSGRKEEVTLRLARLATLTDQGVYTAVSSRPGGGRGAFAGRAFEEGEAICAYGGILTAEHTVRSRPEEERHHSRRTGTGYVWDGYPLAKLFPMPSAEEEEKERSKEPCKRQHLVPHPYTGRHAFCSAFVSHPTPPPYPPFECVAC